MARILLASIHPSYKRGVARIKLVCHTPLISNYSSAANAHIPNIDDRIIEKSDDRLKGFTEN